MSDLTRRSVSQFISWQRCPEQYRLEKIVKVQRGPDVWSHAGTAYHTATEHYDRDQFYDRPEPVEHYYDIFRDQMDQMLTEEEARTEIPISEFRTSKGADYEWWVDHGPGLIDEYIAWRHETDYGIAVDKDGQPAIEVHFEITLTRLDGEKFILNGYIDRVFTDVPDVHGDLVVDLKTGMSQSDQIQLGTYAAAWHQMTGRYCDTGAFYMARKNGLSTPRWLGALASMRALNGAYGELDRSVQAGIFPPRMGNECISCFVREHCQYADVSGISS